VDLVSLIVGLPFAPLRGLVALAEVIADEAERQRYDPREVRRAVEQIEAAEAAHELSPEEAANMKEQALNRLRPD
jgi:Gas vesicle protein G